MALSNVALHSKIVCCLYYHCPIVVSGVSGQSTEPPVHGIPRGLLVDYPKIGYTTEVLRLG